jgi:hypothetical protein
MTIVKVIELIGEGKSIEDAMESAVKEASQTIKDIHQVYLEHCYGVVENNKVTKYRVNVKVSFIVHH